MNECKYYNQCYNEHKQKITCKKYHGNVYLYDCFKNVQSAVEKKIHDMLESEYYERIKNYNSKIK